MLNTRLAAAESMTHDVIRDLLGVKLDMTNYAVNNLFSYPLTRLIFSLQLACLNSLTITFCLQSLLDQQKLQELTEKARHQSEQSQEKV